MKYLVINNNEIVQILESAPGFLPDGFIVMEYDGTIPNEYIGVSSGTVVDLTPVVAPTVPTTPSLDEIKSIGANKVDVAAGTVRMKYITVVPGQAETYLEKSEEAIDYAVAGYPADTTNYPLVQAEANVTGQTPRQAADTIIAMKGQWITKAAQIEEARRRGKIAIQAATSEADVDAARNAAIAALNLL